MRIFLLFLCTYAKEVASLNLDFSPAKIYAPTSTCRSGSDLPLICSTYGFKKTSEAVYVYLIKDDTEIKEKKQQRKEYLETIFILSRVSTKDNGNYSCMFTQKKNPSSGLRGKGDNSVTITVMDIWIHADLTTGLSIVRDGDDVEFTCGMSDPTKVADSSFVHCYLIKNGAIHLVQMFDIQKMKAIFRLRAQSYEASGNYRCALLLLDSLPEKDTNLHGNTNVFLQVKKRERWLGVVNGTVMAMVAVVILAFSLYIYISKQGALQCCRGGTQTVVNEDLPFTGEVYDDGALDIEEEQCFSPDSSDEFSNHESVQDFHEYDQIMNPIREEEPEIQTIQDKVLYCTVDRKVTKPEQETVLEFDI